MRLIPLISAVLVCAVLYLLILERDWIFGLAKGEDVALADALPGTGDADTPQSPEPVAVADRSASGDEAVIRVVAVRSVAREVDSAVLLRGETEAARQVDVMAETSGTIVNDPLRKGSFVEAGQTLCVLDPGIRQDSLEEALARLAEASSRVPEAEARLAEALAALPAAKARIAEAQANVPAARAGLSEAEAGIPAARARLIEAEARVPEAEARLAEARARVPEAEARLAEARAAVPAARARLAEAEARRPEAEARLIEARARVEEARIALNAAERLSEGGFASETRVAAARAAMESARAGVQSAQSQAKAAEAGIENAKSQVEGAAAAVQSAMSQVEAARAGISSAQSGVQNALAGIESAKSQIEGAQARVESARGQIEGANAAVIAVTSQVEGSEAAIQSAKSGIENAKSGIQSAEAAVASARREITRLTVVAPFAGLLESDTAELGALLNANGPSGAHCATVIQLDPIKLVGFVPETEVSRVQVGARAGARLAAGGGDVVGKVTYLARSADETTRTFRVEIEVPNPDLAIGDGQTAEIAIAAPGSAAHLLPQSALTLNDAGALGVRVVAEGNRAAFAPVELIRDTARGVWVGGLPPEAAVIVVGQEFVGEGVAVEPVWREETTQ